MAINDKYQMIAARVVSMMERDGLEWVRDWSANASGTNATTGNRYRGINQLWLAMSAAEHGWGSSLWATYKQWVSIGDDGAGAQVRKGEKGTQIVRWVTRRTATCDHDAAGVTRCAGCRVVPKTFTVFNEAQVDGFVLVDGSREPAELDSVWVRPGGQHLNRADRDANIEAFIAATGASISYGDDAFYSPNTDRICLPVFGAFHSPEAAYSTAFHELVHWTGHPSRLNRLNAAAPKGSDEYAFEELVAELGAAFLCGDLQVSAEPREDHAAYLKSWIRRLRDDPGAIVTAARHAAAATTFLVDLVNENTPPVPPATSGLAPDVGEPMAALAA